ncbi:hypothetical protein IV417_04380 [Alphaproteobacteria bacterium KMM 3653]|uniref:Uncharacterized protein n=1 Tax=Harenicola maris TaxID=2841044 RepID=A0AAP2CNZ6_9RHOB|nr:hypothetical protein [Harenicola maris]
MSYTAILTLGLALGWAGNMMFQGGGSAPTEAEVTSTASQPARAALVAPVVEEPVEEVAIAPEVKDLPAEPKAEEPEVASAEEAETPEYTPIQRKLVEAIKRNAEASQGAEASSVADGITLDYMAVEGLTVNYFYTIDRPFAVINHVSIREEKTAQIQASLCANPGVKTIYQHGLRYAYHFFSSDDKMVIRIDGDVDAC